MNVDVKVTLQKLHERFPQFELDDLFAVLDCISYEPVSWQNTIYTAQDYYTGGIKTNHASME